MLPDIAFTVKQPYEEFTYTYDFAPLLVTGETLVTHAVTASKLADNSDVTATVLGGTAINALTVKAVIKAGVNAIDYRVTFRVVTSLGNKYEEDLRLYVRET
jgi:hypothetical protein